ncbi:hypothetical protein QF042_003526 [Pedobacter sp. W3I1]|uniref:hypothetical protein n=1 Tax=Pedobacter sp. W3I1 TaxID=3042291 RepID=UPI00278A173D|nr:hypothetical protein [Pedobacter sp. W3I1]MDQ0639961.1 hypothetical protein [Pedobacter sp. W3I1]
MIFFRTIVVPGLLSFKHKRNMMEDPKEKDENEHAGHEDTAQEQSSGNENGKSENANWDEHQQVDEEGNEVGPDDIK